MLFNRFENGGVELCQLLGFIDADTNFEKWETWVKLSVGQVTALTGKGLYNRALEHYKTDYVGYDGKEADDLLVQKFQLTNALFAYVKLLPSLDAGHGNDGRKRQLGEQDRGLTALEAYKDEMNIQHLAYEALEDLLVFAEEKKFDEWIQSDNRKWSNFLFIPNLTTFNRYYVLNSTRMYYHLVPIIREVQENQIKPIVTSERYKTMLTAIGKENPTEEDKEWIEFVQDYICRPLVFGALSLALQRLPIELFPEGLMQTQVIGTLKEQRIATENTRLSLINSLKGDAERGIDRLQAQIEILDGADVQDRFVEPPKASDVIKGFVM